MSLREFNFKSNNTQKGAHSLTDRPERIQTCTYTHVGISCKRGVICEFGNEHLTSVLWGLYAHTCWVLNKTVPVVINIIFSFKDSEVILEAFIYLFVENLLTSWQQSTEEMLWQMKGFVLVALKAGRGWFSKSSLLLLLFTTSPGYSRIVGGMQTTGLVSWYVLDKLTEALFLHHLNNSQHCILATDCSCLLHKESFCSEIILAWFSWHLADGQNGSRRNKSHGGYTDFICCRRIWPSSK